MVSHSENVDLQKAIPLMLKNKAALHEAASKARTAVACEVVDLCNALMRRANDIVTAIDMAEDAKSKTLTRAMSDLKVAQDRFQKIDFFTNMALSSLSSDLPGEN